MSRRLLKCQGQLTERREIIVLFKLPVQLCTSNRYLVWAGQLHRKKWASQDEWFPPARHLPLSLKLEPWIPTINLLVCFCFAITHLCDIILIPPSLRCLNFELVYAQHKRMSSVAWYNSSKARELSQRHCSGSSTTVISFLLHVDTQYDNLCLFRSSVSGTRTLAWRHVVQALGPLGLYSLVSHLGFLASNFSTSWEPSSSSSCGLVLFVVGWGFWVSISSGP